MDSEKQIRYAKLYETISNDLYINYAFPLDSFQKSAIYSLHTQSEDILVTAHTSAGKTIVAEYAISVVLSSHSSSDESRIIYTSPIKSLSNQKFSDFRKLFGAENVGIITGDVSINERAPCLIMTTEILRNMLYMNHDMLSSIKTVIFDEVHYITDKSRGVVWEESMILLPKDVKLVLLSATINNKKNFMDWIVNIRKSEMFNSSTKSRPVDLDFYIWFNNNSYLFKSTSDKLFKLDNKKVITREHSTTNNSTSSSTFDININNNTEQDKVNTNTKEVDNNTNTNIKEDTKMKKENKNDNNKHSLYSQRCKCDEVLRKIERKLDPSHLYLHTSKSYSNRSSQSEILKFLTQNFVSLNLAPLLIFCFSQKKVESIASSLSDANQLQLSDPRTSSQISIILETVFSKLKKEDQQLPQVELVKNYLLRGIGIHHSGLLPMLKEVTEMLFKWKLIQIIIATETIGMGVNYPAKTVIFDGLFKHDGISLRGLTANECKQMCGRAGRRGKDSLGEIYVIYNKEKKIDREVIKTAFFGSSEEMESQFKVSYTMVLNAIGKFGTGFSKFANQSLKQYELVKHYNNRNNVYKEVCEVLNRNEDLLEFSKVYMEYISRLKALTYLLVNSRSVNKLLFKGVMFFTFDEFFVPVLGVVLEVCKNGVKVLYFDFVGNLGNVEGVLKEDVKEVVKEGRKFTMCTVKNKVIHGIVERKVDVGDVTNVQKINYKSINTFITTSLGINHTNTNNNTNNNVNDNNNNNDDSKNNKKKNYKGSKVKDLVFTLINIKKLKIKDVKTMMLYEQLIKLNNKLKNNNVFINKPEFFFPFTENNNTQQSNDNKNKNNENLLLHKVIGLEQQRVHLKEQLDTENTQLNNDYILKFNELIKLGFIENGEEPILSIKGRFSILLKSCESQVWLTELIFEGMFNDLKEEEIVALISMFYFGKGANVTEFFEFKNANNFDIENKHEIDDIGIIESLKVESKSEEVNESENRIYNFIKKLNEFIKISKNKLKENNCEYFGNIGTEFRTGAINAVYWWMKKEDLSTIVDNFGINEGSLTRILNRINYLLEELVVACETVINNENLVEIFKKCKEILKRDIMFVESLYFDKCFDDIEL